MNNDVYFPEIVIQQFHGKNNAPFVLSVTASLLSSSSFFHQKITTHNLCCKFLLLVKIVHG